MQDTSNQSNPRHSSKGSQQNFQTTSSVHKIKRGDSKTMTINMAKKAQLLTSPPELRTEPRTEPSTLTGTMHLKKFKQQLLSIVERKKNSSQSP